MKLGQPENNRLYVNSISVTGTLGERKECNQDGFQHYFLKMPQEVINALKNIPDLKTKKHLLKTVVETAALLLGKKVAENPHALDSGATLTWSVVFKLDPNAAPTVVTAQIGDSQTHIISNEDKLLASNILNSTPRHNKKNSDEQKRAELAGGKWQGKNQTHITAYAPERFDVVKKIDENSELNRFQYFFTRSDKEWYQVNCVCFDPNERKQYITVINLYSFKAFLDDEDRFRLFNNALDYQKLATLKEFIPDLWKFTKEIRYTNQANLFQDCFTAGLSTLRALGNERTRQSNPRVLTRTPEMVVWDMPKDSGLLLGTDGLFDYFDSNFITTQYRLNRANRLRPQKFAEQFGREIASTTQKKRWKYRDDITVVFAENLEALSEDEILVLLVTDGHYDKGHFVSQDVVAKNRACLETALQQIFFTLYFENILSKLNNGKLSEEKDQNLLLAFTAPRKFPVNKESKDCDVVFNNFTPKQLDAIAQLLKLIFGGEIRVRIENQSNRLTIIFSSVWVPKERRCRKFFSQYENQDNNYDAMKLFFKELHRDFAATYTEKFTLKKEDETSFDITTTVEITNWLLFESHLKKHLETHIAGCALKELISLKALTI